MQSPKHIVVVAGEESGDIHAAKWITDLKSAHSHITFSGIGGIHMQKAGVHLVCDLAKHGVTGISEVLRHFNTIKKAFQQIKQHLTINKPDLLVLVDYPGFNLRLAKYAKKELGIKILYYIGPQIWAWKAKRLDLIREVVDHMAVILPFEKKIYQQAGVPVSFVGHPLVEQFIHAKPALPTQIANLPHKAKIVALAPGSRTHEIERHMPVLCQTASNLSKVVENLHFVVPVAASLSVQLIEKYLKNSGVNYTLIPNQFLATIAGSDIVLVASGTASLECALLEKPMCIIYKASLISYIAAMKLIKVKYLGLCNLLMGNMVVPELLQYDCSAKELTKTALELLQNTDVRKKMLSRLYDLKIQLSSQAADCTIGELIFREL
jgi:lipid-A-disaccharide synthase